MRSTGVIGLLRALRYENEDRKCGLHGHLFRHAVNGKARTRPQEKRISMIMAKQSLFKWHHIF